MLPEALWRRYAAIWSLEPEKRQAELAVCLADDGTYCDPNGLVAGRQALSDYMGRFQGSVPGGRFQIRSVLHHHDRSLANWLLRGTTGDILQAGTSFATLADDGRFRAISGFFHARDEEAPR